MKYFILTLLSIVFLGCSGAQMAHGITKTQIEISGNKPPSYFEFANLETMRDYVFNTKDFSFSLPSAKEKDYTVMGGWVGESMRDGKTIAMGLKKTITYQVVLTASKVSEYTERDKAINIHDLTYIRTRFHKYQPETKVSILNYGKENYDCVILEYEKKGFNNAKKKGKTYRCYKFNPSRTKSKDVTISLTYTKPNNPTIAKQYTYQDLQNRAKRVLDSLYIKDGW